jgi:hypothetical protein
VNLYEGRVTHPRVAEAHGIEVRPLADLISG